MKFSIVVPIYNVEAYLDRCVDSLLRQTYKDIEIILVDDESPDNCPQKCDEYANTDSRIRVIHKKNGGLSDARNQGIKIAQGEYIIFVDADDYIDIDACEQLSKIVKSDVDVIVTDAYVEGGDLNLCHEEYDGIITGENFLLKALKFNSVHMAVWLNVYRRKFLVDNNLLFKKGILHEDEQFTPRVLLKTKKIVVLNYAFYHYVIRQNSITTKKDKRKNARDFYSTCVELELVYNECSNTELRLLLLNSLVDKYLGLFQQGKLYQYGEEYLHKEFIKKNAYCRKTKYKAMLYCFSPRLYYVINLLSKKFNEFCR